MQGFAATAVVPWIHEANPPEKAGKESPRLEPVERVLA